MRARVWDGQTDGRNLAGGDVEGGAIVVRPGVDGRASAWAMIEVG